MEPRSFREVKQALIEQLTLERWVVIGPECPMCSGIIQDAPGIRTVFIIEEMTLDWTEAEALAIYCAENCVLVHAEGCQERAMTEGDLEKCVAQILAFEGFTRIAAWLDMLDQPGRFWRTKQKHYARHVMRNLLSITVMHESKTKVRIRRK